MRRVFSVRFCALFMAIAAAGAARADYSEYLLGDLSNDPQAPTSISLSPGSNLLVASSSSSDLDLLRVNVPANHTLDSIIVQFHDSLNLVFAGVQSGGVWTAGTGFEIDPAPMLGWVDFPTDVHTAHTGENILDDMALGAGAQGFTPPLSSGDYTFLFQTSSSAVPFAISFEVSGGMATLPGDFNADRAVNSADLIVWKNSFGKSAIADANGDGRSDGLDVLLWQRNQGLSAALASAASVPEPTALALAAGSVVLLGVVRRVMGARR